MHLGLISDVHGNVAALDRAVSELSGTVDEILLAGDAMHEYRFSNEVVDAVRRLGMRYVLGNHELSLLGHQGLRARAVPTVNHDHLAFVATVPTRLDVRVGGKRLCMVHGSPWEPHHQYLYPGDPLLERCDEMGADFLILGHTHAPMVQRFGRTLVVNPGTLGADARGTGDRGMVSYAVLDTDSEEVEMVRFRNPNLPAIATTGER